MLVHDSPSMTSSPNSGYYIIGLCMGIYWREVWEDRVGVIIHVADFDPSKSMHSISLATYYTTQKLYLYPPIISIADFCKGLGFLSTVQFKSHTSLVSKNISISCLYSMDCINKKRSPDSKFKIQWTISLQSSHPYESALFGIVPGTFNHTEKKLLIFRRR